ncbi:MAG: serpin family protein, partial [Planctomycetota bacterium]
GASLDRLDFAGDPEGARKTINAWVEKETQEKIKELLKAGMIDAGTKLVLVNAIYFKGNWASQFKKEDTRAGPFTVCAKDNPQAVDLPLMHRTGQYPYFVDDAVQALALPYQGGNLAMVVLLPAAPDGAGLGALAGALENLEQKLTPENLAAWLGHLRPQEVQVTLPLFKVTGEYKLNEALIALGMADAFSPANADFTGILPRPDDLYISLVAHKAYVDVNEEGTEAAAATAVVMKPRGLAHRTEFRADRSFLFLIRDTKSGAILFLGRVLNPKAG